MPAQAYYCSCPAVCKKLTTVSRRTYERHAKHRNKLTMSFDDFSNLDKSGGGSDTPRRPGPRSRDEHSETGHNGQEMDGPTMDHQMMTQGDDNQVMDGQLMGDEDDQGIGDRGYWAGDKDHWIGGNGKEHHRTTVGDANQDQDHQGVSDDDQGMDEEEIEHGGSGHTVSIFFAVYIHLAQHSAVLPFLISPIRVAQTHQTMIHV